MNGFPVLSCKFNVWIYSFSAVQSLVLPLGGIPFGPEFFPVDKHVSVGRSIAVFHIIPEFSGTDRYMIQHEIRHHIILFGQPVDVVPGSEGGIHLIVIDYGKSPVTG